MTKTFKQIRENGGGDSGLPTYSYSTSVVVSNKKPKKFESESLIDNVKKAVEIAKKMAGNYTGAVNEIEKIQKGLSKHIRVADALRLANEEAPANATGTAVAGTGDDSSTVVVKKKKEQKSKLMRRITDSIDKAIPDIRKEEDEITTRKNQLKELAKNRNV